jgi:hypothetical protein
MNRAFWSQKFRDAPRMGQGEKLGDRNPPAGHLDEPHMDDRGVARVASQIEKIGGGAGDRGT